MQNKDFDPNNPSINNHEITPKISSIIDSDINVMIDGNIMDHLWSADGTKIAYTKCPDGQNYNCEVWVAERNLTSTEITNKVLVSSEADPYGLEDWRDDWIMFRTKHQEGTPASYYGRNELWKIRDNGSDLTQLTFTYTNGIRTVFGPSSYWPNMGTINWGRFVPGTDLIYYKAHDGNGWWKAFTSKDDGSDQWYSISGSTYAFQIGMSPTGNKLVWGHQPGGVSTATSIYASNVDGSGVTLLKAYSECVGILVLADGYTILTSWPNGDIGAINMDGSNDRILISDQQVNLIGGYNPVYGEAYLMTSNRTDGNLHVFQLTANGSGITQLTDGGFNDENPEYSPDGQYIMYRRLPSGFDTSGGPPYPYELVIKKLSNVISDGNIMDHLWSVDGTKIAYTKCPVGQNYNCEIWVAERDSTSTEITNKVLISSEADPYGLEDWRDDWIMFRTKHQEGTPASYYGRNELWKIRDNGSDLTQLTFTYTNGIRTVFGPSSYWPNMGTINWGRFIPGTDLIYYKAHDGNGWWKAFTSKDDGSDQWHSISGSMFAFQIGISPTGNKLVFGHQPGGVSTATSIYTSNVDGSEVTLVKSYSESVEIFVLADGYTILTSWPNGDVGAINMDGTNDRILISGQQENYIGGYNPIYGESFLITSNSTDGTLYTYQLTADGSGITQLTDGRFNDEQPDYSPDGQYIMYRRLPSNFDTSGGPPFPYELVIKKVADISSSSVRFSIPTPEPDYQVKLMFDSENFDYSKANPDGSDLRFKDISGNSLNYWIESWDPAGTSIVWIKIPQAGTTNITIFYGNPAAIPVSNGDKTFIFFDDFTNSIVDSSKWNIETDIYSSATINSGIATLHVDTPSDHAAGSVIGFTEAGVIHGQAYGSKEGNSIAFGASYGEGDVVVTANGGIAPRTTTPNTVPLMQWFTGQIRWINDTYVEFNNGTNTVVHTDAIPSVILPVRMVVLDMLAGPGAWYGAAFNSVNNFTQAGDALNFRAYYDYNPEAPVTLQTDWIFVRKTSLIEPFASMSEFEPLSPLNNSILVNTKLTFEWYSKLTDVSFLVQISTDQSFTNLIINVSTAEMSYSPSVPLPEGTLYWRIAFINSSGLIDKIYSPLVFHINLISPLINGPNDFSILEGKTGYTILWTADDTNPGNYFVYKNDTLFQTGDWSAKFVLISLDGLSAGVYNFTCVVFDTLGSSASDQVWLIVLPNAPDTTPPTISSPMDRTIEEGSIGYEIVWTGYDLHPWSVTVTKNDSIVYEGAWIGNEIRMSLDNLFIGIYYFNCTLFDQDGNSVSDFVQITIIPKAEDNQKPEIEAPVSLQYEEGSIGNIITWNCSDDHPFAYQISINDSVIVHLPWHGENISQSIDGYSEGLWLINLTLWDLVGNNRSTITSLTVIPPTPDITAPTIIQPANIITSTSKPITIIWIVDDEHPANYVIYLNGTEYVKSESWDSGIIQITLYNLNIGTWFINLTVWDKVGHQSFSVVTVDVLSDSSFDTDPPEISHLADLMIDYGSKGNIAVFFIYDQHPSGYNLSINEKLINLYEWSDINVRVNISLDSLSIGKYIVTLTAWDIFGNTETQSFNVTVIGDEIPPTINQPADLLMTGSGEVSIIWEVNDLHPSYYEIYSVLGYNDLHLLENRSWSGNLITYKATLSSGEYTIRCIIYDLSGNTAYNDVHVTILSSTSSANTPGYEFLTIIAFLFIIVPKRVNIFSKRRKKV